jgi:hypothetical protein
MHGIVPLILGVIALTIILLVVGLVALWVLVVTLTTIMVLIVSITIVRLAIVTIGLVTLMVIAVFVTAMLTLAQFMATHGRKMSHFPFLWLHLVLGYLLENASCLVGCLTLLKESNHPERDSRPCLVQVIKIVLVPLWLCEEDLLTLLLHHGYIHCSMEIVTLEA